MRIIPSKRDSTHKKEIGRLGRHKPTLSGNSQMKQSGKSHKTNFLKKKGKNEKTTGKNRRRSKSNPHWRVKVGDFLG